MPENFEIANTWVLWLTPLPIIVYWLLPAMKMRSASLLMPNFSKVEEYSGTRAQRSAFVKTRKFLSWLTLGIVWLLLLATLSSPQLVGEPTLKVKTSRNFLILADISFSMAQTDWILDGERVRRWDAVKSVLHDFVEKREGDRMGLLFFGSSAYIQAPFTTDLITIDKMLDEADVGMAGQMTNIGKAIVKGIELFDQDTIETKVMLVLTDGVDAGTDVLPLDAADLAKNDSILVYTVGIGDPNSGNSDLDENTLIEIAELTGAQYFRAIDAERLEEIYAELDKLEPIEFEEEEYTPKTMLYYYPMAAALSILVLVTLLLNISQLFRKRDGLSD